jgi:hypothetical protein
MAPALYQNRLPLALATLALELSMCGSSQWHPAATGVGGVTEGVQWGGTSHFVTQVGNLGEVNLRWIAIATPSQNEDAILRNGLFWLFWLLKSNYHVLMGIQGLSIVV